MNPEDRVSGLLNEFKQGKYLYGPGVLINLGGFVTDTGKKVAIIADDFRDSSVFVNKIRESLQGAGLHITAEILGAAPNAPREDVSRILHEIRNAGPDLLVSFGGGSTIDAVKAAEVLRTLGGDIEEYFGAGLVTKALRRSGKYLSPHVAIQSVASSAAHLTKYSNITDMSTGQDLGIAFARAMFAFAEKIGFPTKLTDVPGFSEEHIGRALIAAKNPQLKSKLENMPIPLSVDMVDEYMGSVLEAAKTGDLTRIKNA